MNQPTRATGLDPIGDDAAGRHLAYALRLDRVLVGFGPDAEDVAAESVARLLSRRGTRLDDPTAYLRRIVVNQVIGRQRHFRTEQRSEADSYPTPRPPTTQS